MYIIYIYIYIYIHIHTFDVVMNHFSKSNDERKKYFTNQM